MSLRIIFAMRQPPSSSDSRTQTKSQSHTLMIAECIMYRLTAVSVHRTTSDRQALFPLYSSKTKATICVALAGRGAHTPCIQTFP